MADVPWITALIQLVTASGIAINSGLAIMAFMQSRKNAVKIQEIHVSIDGRMDEIVRMTKMAAHAEGFKDGQDDGKASGNGDNYIIDRLKR
jgi:hypothetical protein